MKRRSFVAGLGALGAACVLPARAQDSSPAVLAFTATTDFTSTFVAVEEGMFKKRELALQPQFIPLNSTIPAALQAGSLQLGGPTPSVFLQAVDGGLDLVAVAGAGATTKNSRNAGLVARKDSGIHSAQDCIGKKIGVPGLGAFLHVTLRAWLKANDVDYRKVTFVEVAFPQHADVLRGGSVDAVVTGEPALSRIVDSGVGYVASFYLDFMPDGMPTTIYASRRDWAEQNPQQIAAFREGLVEAGEFIVNPANAQRVRDIISRYIKLPPEMLATVPVNTQKAALPAASLEFWIDVMKDQNMLRENLDVKQLLA